VPTRAGLERELESSIECLREVLFPTEFFRYDELMTL
jgi:hypothetical protein